MTSSITSPESSGIILEDKMTFDQIPKLGINCLCITLHKDSLAIFGNVWVLRNDEWERIADERTFPVETVIQPAMQLITETLCRSRQKYFKSRIMKKARQAFYKKYH